MVNPLTLIEASRLTLLDPSTLHFSKKEASLRMTIEGDRSCLDVLVFRAFPLSHPHGYLSIWNGPDEEVGILINPFDLSRDDQVLLKEHLDRRYLVPIVTRILSTKERFGTVDWLVETDRGEVRFTTRNIREHIQRPSPGRVLIEDVDGNRYDVKNVNRLDRKSQELLFRYV